MMSSSFGPLAVREQDAALAALPSTLPKADLHVHAEAGARLERVLARRAGREPFDWQARARHLREAVPPGMARLEQLGAGVEASAELDAVPEHFVARIVDLLEEEAADGAIYVEVRFGRETVLRPDFMPLFREAERQVRARHPRLRAEALCCVTLFPDAARVEPILAGCLRLAREGLAGVDFIPYPYDAEADWTLACGWAERAREVGLGITAHAGEFSSANLAAALRVPGLTRLGHGVYAARDPALLDEMAARGITVECCPTSNVVLGAVGSYAEHPIQMMRAHGVAVTLNTDDPVRVCTTIGREYAVAAELGFGQDELLACTRSALEAAFTTRERRAALLAEVAGWRGPTAGA